MNRTVSVLKGRKEDRQTDKQKYVKWSVLRRKTRQRRRIQSSEDCYLVGAQGREEASHAPTCLKEEYFRQKNQQM